MKNKQLIILISIFSLFILSVIVPVRGFDTESDNWIVKSMSCNVEYIEDGDNYRVNGSVEFISSWDVEWEVRAVFTKNETNTFEAFKNLVDSEPEYTHSWTPIKTSMLDSNSWIWEKQLYYNKLLINGGYYGVILYASYNNITYRKMGLFIYIGSIVVTQVYNTTGWYDFEYNSASIETGISWVTSRWRTEPPGLSTSSEVQMTLEDEDFEEYWVDTTSIIIDNLTLSHLTTTLLATKIDFEFKMHNGTEYTSADTYTRDGTDGYKTYEWTNLNWNITCFNDTEVNGKMFTVTSGYGEISEVKVLLDLLRNVTLTTIPDTRTASSSGSDRILDKAISILDFLITYLGPIFETLSNNIEIFGTLTVIIGSVTSVLYKVRVTLVNSKEIKKTFGYKVSNEVKKYQRAFKQLKK